MLVPQCAPASVTTGQTIRKNWRIVPPAWKKKVSIKGWLRNVTSCTVNGRWDAQLVLSVHMFLCMRFGYSWIKQWSIWGLQICKTKHIYLSALLFWFVGSYWIKLIVSNWQHRANVRWSRESTYGIMRDPSEIAKESWIGHLHRKDSLPSSPGLTGYLNNPCPSPSVGRTERTGI